MLHAIIAFFARQRFFTSIDVNVYYQAANKKKRDSYCNHLVFSFCGV